MKKQKKEKRPVRGSYRWLVEVEKLRRQAMPMDAPEVDDEAAVERIAREAFSVYKGGR